jgi:hypothetical protein
MHLDAGGAWVEVPLREAKQERLPVCARGLLGPAGSRFERADAGGAAD